MTSMIASAGTVTAILFPSLVSRARIAVIRRLLFLGSFSVAQALMQVCLHSHGHRAQCSMRLRLLGGTPPAMDFVHWLGERPTVDWQ